MISKKKGSASKKTKKSGGRKKAVKTKGGATKRKTVASKVSDKQIHLALISYLITIVVLLLGLSIIVLVFFNEGGDVVSVGVQPGFCGDGICITPREDCRTCSIDCGYCSTESITPTGVATLVVTIKDKRTNMPLDSVETKLYLMEKRGMVYFPVELITEGVVDGTYT